MKIKDTLLGNDGKASRRKITEFAFVLTQLYLVYFDKINSDFMLKVYFINFIFIGYIMGLITTQNIIDFKNGKNNNSTDSNDTI